jgi:outer membrane lipoprotein SlyB
MNKISILILGCLLSACAQTRGYVPTIDTRSSDPKATANLNRDLQECEALASHASGNTAAESAIGAGVGGAIGAATGAVMGAIAGNAGMGAAMGAAAGGLGGATKQGLESDSNYKRLFSNCMRKRGHSVLQ